MQKKILAIFLALAMMLALLPTVAFAVRPEDLADRSVTNAAEALHGVAPSVIVTAETPDYTPQTYSDAVNVEDLRPGDILMDGVTLGTDIEWLETKKSFTSVTI